MAFKDLEMKRAYHREWQRKHRLLGKPLSARARAKARAANKRYELKHPDKRRTNQQRQNAKAVQRRRLQTMGLEAARYDELVAAQHNCCAICGEPERQKVRGNSGKIRALAADHDHKTGKLRGLLCGKHNIGLGLFADNPELLIKAAEYLKKNGVTS